MKKSLILLTALLAVAFQPEASAQLFGKKKAEAKTETEKKETPKPSAYEKLLKDATTSKSNFITLHKVKEKLYFEIPMTTLGREMLMASTLTEISEQAFGTVGYKEKDPLHVQFILEDSLVLLKQLNVGVTVDADNSALKEAISKNYGSSIISKNKIEAWNKDSTAVVIDMTAMFLSDYKPFSFLGNYGILNVTGNYKGNNSMLGEIKAFDDNVSIKSTLSYDVSIKFLFFTFVENEPVTAKVTRSILLLPEKKMTPRIADSRVGVFPTDKLHFTTKRDGSLNYSFANRWRIEPSDPEAYKRGELVEPAKPIVFYIDSAFPESWKEPIKEGTLSWNKAFEAIGFKNAIQVRDFPKDDPEFDPDNLKYSCIRFLPSTTENAMGPSWVDPTTGEIINATVLVYNDVIKLTNQWRYVQTAQLDPSIRTGKLTDEKLRESLQYVIAHEVGHCLGFMHNMGASSAFPVDSLRSVTFTQKYGTTPTIMDYARFNYVAQPQDKGVNLNPPALGVGDYFLVKWSYQPVEGATSAWDEKATVESWVDEKAGGPLYRYGRQQIFARYDPSALEEDLGDDPMKAGAYGIANLKYILANYNGWVKNDDDFTYRDEIYSHIVNQYYRYIRNVMYNVGGIYLTEVKDGTKGDRHLSVPKEVQKQSLAWVMNEYRNADWLNNQELRKNLSLSVDPTTLLRGKVASDLKKLVKNVLLSAHISDNPYSLKEFMNDLYLNAFENSLKGRRLTAGDMALQNFLATMAVEPFEDKKGGSLLLLNDLAYTPSVDEIIAYNLDQTGLVRKYADLLRRVEQEKGEGYVAAQMRLNTFGYSYGFMQNVNTNSIDNSKLYLLDMAYKIQKLASSKAATASGDDRLHYQALLLQVNKALKNK